MDWFMIPLNVAIIFGTGYKIIELFVHRRERLMLINKIAEIKDIGFRGISLYNSGNKFTSLRIGYLMAGIGTGFLAGFLINLIATGGDYANTSHEGWWNYQSHVAGIVYVASICLCGGIALLLSYKAEQRAEHPETQKKDDEFSI